MYGTEDRVIARDAAGNFRPVHGIKRCRHSHGHTGYRPYDQQISCNVHRQETILQNSQILLIHSGRTGLHDRVFLPAAADGNLCKLQFPDVPRNRRLRYAKPLLLQVLCQFFLCLTIIPVNQIDNLGMSTNLHLVFPLSDLNLHLVPGF